MKRQLILILVVIQFIQANVFGQANDRDYILSKVRVFYLSNPNDTTGVINAISANSIINNANIFGSSGNSNMDRCAEFLKQLFKPVSSGGMPDLQRYTASIIRFNNKIVNMYFLMILIDPCHKQLKEHMDSVHPRLICMALCKALFKWQNCRYSIWSNISW